MLLTINTLCFGRRVSHVGRTFECIRRKKKSKDSTAACAHVPSWAGAIRRESTNEEMAVVFSTLKMKARVP